VPTFDEIADRLRWAFGEESERLARRRALFAGNAPAAVDERIDLMDRGIREIQDLIKGYLEQLISYPPHHERHAIKRAAFRERIGERQRTVFVMTKYPESDGLADQELLRVIKTVTDAVRDCGFAACIAATNRFVPDLWENVELHLLESGRGIAVVEDIYRPELNPNVAFEWGWMRGMGKDVLYLGEQTFKHQRADWGGLIVDRFSWKEPEKTIPDAIRKWLQPGKVP
jgi:hypothetical protein